MRSYAFLRVRYESPTIEIVEINVVMNVITHCILTNRAGDRKVKPFGRKNPTSYGHDSENLDKSITFHPLSIQRKRKIKMPFYYFIYFINRFYYIFIYLGEA